MGLERDSSPGCERVPDPFANDGLVRYRAAESYVAALHEGLDAAEVRRAIERQTCPWCGAGPYRNLALHTAQRHGVLADDLRDLAGLDPRSPTCSPMYSDTQQRLATEKWQPGAASRTSWEAQREAIQARSAALLRMWRDGMTMTELAATTGLAKSGLRRWFREFGMIEDARTEGPAVERKKVKRGPEPWRRKARCVRGHEFTPENTRMTRDGKQSCRECSRLHDRKRPSGSVRQRIAREKADLLHAAAEVDATTQSEDLKGA